MDVGIISRRSHEEEDKKCNSTKHDPRYYDPAKPAVLQCDASEYGLGTALLEGGQPIAFASRTLSDTEKRYAQIEKECLAIVFACEKFQYYIWGKESVCVESDHKPLEAIFKKASLRHQRDCNACCFSYSVLTSWFDTSHGQRCT